MISSQRPWPLDQEAGRIETVVVSLKYYSEINFDGMRKTTGDLSQDNRYVYRADSEVSKEAIPEQL